MMSAATARGEDTISRSERRPRRALAEIALDDRAERHHRLRLRPRELRLGDDQLSLTAANPDAALVRRDDLAAAPFVRLIDGMSGQYLETFAADVGVTAVRRMKRSHSPLQRVCC